MTKSFGIRVGALGIAAAFVCVGSPAVFANSPGYLAHTRSAPRTSAGSFRPFAKEKLNQLAAAHQPLVDRSAGAFVPRTNHDVLSTNWVIASSIYGGIIDLYDGNTGTIIASCDGCGGWGIAVNKMNGNLAAVT